MDALRATTKMTEPQPPTRLLPPPPPPPPLPFLAEELIFEILPWLPAGSLLRFRSVCKSWKTLIDSPKFVKSHLRNSISGTSTTHQQLAYFTDHEHGKLETSSLRSLFENPAAPPVTVSFNVEPNHQFIAGSCNGLLCLVDLDRCFRLLNPCTRLESKRSPPPWNSPTHYGFGYDQVNHKYKVLIVHNSFPKWSKVHTFGTNSWKRIQNSACHLDGRDMTGKFVSGTLNWLAVKRDPSVKSVIVSFDVEKETYGEVLLPPGLDGKRLTNHVLDFSRNCLCLSYANGNRCTVWLMKKYGVQESWMKLKLISHGKFFITRGIDPYVNFRPMCISENGVILAASRDLQLFMHDPNRGTFDYPKINERLRRDMHIYRGSLVSPNVISVESF